MAKIKVTNPKQIINGGAKKYYFKVKGVGGIKGDKGDKGDTGSQGPQGPQGNAATIEVGSTTTLPTGYDATVTNTGTINNAILNFGIPRGIKGDTGAKGDKGDKGDKGEQGNTGPQGPAGQNATVYVGTTTTGAPGTQASVYNSGTDRNAVLNFTIPQGATGATGPQGPAGQDGQNFTPTIVETLPTTGDQSKLYLTPKDYTTGTATGNPITISLGEDAGQITSAQLDGDTFQQSYTGKNLFNKSNYHELACWITNSGVLKTGNNWTFWIPCLPNTTYTIQKMVQQPTEKNRFQIATSSVQPEIGTQASGKWSVADGDTTTSHAYTTAADANYLIFNVGNYDPNPATTTTKNELLGSIQVELGSTATSYEPYVGGVPSPNPDYPQQIQTVTGEQTIRICGLNIYDKSKDLVGYALTGDGVETAFAAWHITDYIPVVGGETYIVTGMTTPGGAAKTCYYDSAKNLIEAVPQQASPYTITPPSGSEYVRLSIYNTAQIADSNTLQIELGSTAHNYEAYNGTDCPISLGSIELCKIGDYQDYVYKSGEKWYVHKESGKYVYNNDLGENGIGSAYVAMLTPTLPTLPNMAFTDGLFWCNSYTPTMRKNTGLQGTNASGRIRVNTSLDIADSYAKVRALAAANNLTIHYPLATATDTEITNTTLIAQLEAIRTASLQASNTITNTATGSNLAGDMELGYCEYDPTNRYDKWLWLDLNNNYEKLGS